MAMGKGSEKKNNLALIARDKPNMNQRCFKIASTCLEPKCTGDSYVR